MVERVQALEEKIQQHEAQLTFFLGLVVVPGLKNSMTPPIRNAPTFRTRRIILSTSSFAHPALCWQEMSRCRQDPLPVRARQDLLPDGARTSLPMPARHPMQVRAMKPVVVLKVSSVSVVVARVGSERTEEAWSPQKAVV